MHLLQMYIAACTHIVIHYHTNHVFLDIASVLSSLQLHQNAQAIEILEQLYKVHNFLGNL